ncbi:aminotransferase class I/II-fold pyridoxal phosphate-dependent enzyme [Rhodocytophaga rosea]|uniref:Aminotransferase class I/II-fold pyridoxal phosphate-dependent enzyme n=1 Tax=Rhodocytophaga rosea TaxID=2704465 RepID=A0A6C0GHS9_9BACT|nr:GntG family PLP-dependent aldolase [Rhodocytophaga rosea]QHT67263.1 aminotransferase class I/II-fold pyridoxal phosphate-dependent enzyme [Rhodocytophaga rosea]
MQTTLKEIIDLRSDTVTKPTPGMLQAMLSAQVGDDVYEEDPMVNELQEKTAHIFGMEAGLFCPSGTMTNQIAIRILTQPGDEVICDRLAHIYNYEGGGIAVNSLASVRLVHGERGRFTPQDVLENINDDNVHYPRTSLVALENTVNKGGGCYYTLDQIAAISKVCRQHRISLHLDGARVFNALVATGESPAEYGKYFDTISVCLSKGLGAPVGSVLLGSHQLIAKAKRMRKLMGGGWRQAGFLAAAGIYALDHHIQRLSEDHIRARKIAQALQQLPVVEEILPVDTNIVIFKLSSEKTTQDFLTYLKEQQILASAFGKDKIRIVTHLDFTDAMLERLIVVLQKLPVLATK